jgi:Spy/CpxP family protein refolding chaperone
MLLVRADVAMRAVVLLIVAMAFLPAAWADDQKPPAGPRNGGSYRRLPAHYKDVVSEQQRDAIYQIQEEFGAKIAELKARLAELQNEQAAKVEAVLSPEQKQKITKLKAAAATRRAGKSPAAKP